MATLLEHLGKRVCVRQWHDMLKAFAAELEATLSVADLTTVMRQTGTRYAATHKLPTCQTMEEASQFMNAHWENVDWGYMAWQEQADRLEIRHYAAPLSSAFGSENAWAPALLEGIYQTWLSQVGMPEGLVVRATPLQDTPYVLAFNVSATR